MWKRNLKKTKMLMKRWLWKMRYLSLWTSQKILILLKKLWMVEMSQMMKMRRRKIKLRKPAHHP